MCQATRLWRAGRSCGPVCVRALRSRGTTRSCGAHDRPRPAPIRSSWTNKLIPANDHGSVQINVAHLDENGVYNGSFSTFALQGKVRSRVR